MRTIVIDYKADGTWGFHVLDQPLIYTMMENAQQWLDKIELGDTVLRVSWSVGVSQPQVVHSQGKVEIQEGEAIGHLVTQNHVHPIERITYDGKELPVHMFTEMLPNSECYVWN